MTDAATETLARLPQPFGFYRVFTGSEDLHFGYWPPEHPEFTIAEAQAELSRRMWARLPMAPAKVLEVGCGLGVMAERLHQAGYEVTAIAPDAGLIDYANVYHAGPTYLAHGFMDAHPALQTPAQYDVVLFQESLQYLPDLDAVFQRVHSLLKPAGRLIICDEVSRHSATRHDSAVHDALAIEEALGANGFFARHHEIMDRAVTPTCDVALRGFQETREQLIAIYGAEVEPMIDHFITGWSQQKAWYADGSFGYELWELQATDLQTATYRNGDETTVLQSFQDVFQTQRSQSHWAWKFKQSPFGGPCMANVWDGHTLAAHYAGYPAPLWLENGPGLTYQAGDTFTHPDYRGVGRGKTSVLARAYRHFERHYFERQITFAYGFNTDKILRFGKLFLGYEDATPVYEWVLTDKQLALLKSRARLSYRWRGYRVLCTDCPDTWADVIFHAAKGNYDWLTARTQDWLTWRYQAHPDFQYHFFVVRHWERPVGWWLARVENNTLLLGDALFAEASPHAIQAGLQAAIQFFEQTGVRINRVQGWFSNTPDWWTTQLQQQGFVPQRQFQNLHLCVKPFADDLTAEQIAQRFYFTWGDSDLF